MGEFSRTAPSCCLPNHDLCIPWICHDHVSNLIAQLLPIMYEVPSPIIRHYLHTFLFQDRDQSQSIRSVQVLLLAGCRSHRIRNAIKFLADPRLDLLTPLYLIGCTSQCSRHDNYRLSYNSCGLHDLLPARSGRSLASSSIVVSQIARFCMPGQLSLTDCMNRIRTTSTNICTLLHAPAKLEVFGDRPYWEPHLRSSLRFHRWAVLSTPPPACASTYANRENSLQRENLRALAN